MKRLYWIKSQQGTDFFMDGKKVGTAMGEKGAQDTFALVESGVICWTRKTDRKVDAMTMRYTADYEMQYQLIPALQYDGNRCGIQDYIDVRNASTAQKKKEGKKGPTYFIGHFEESSGKPWRFGWHRSSVPGATYSEGRESAAALFLPAGQVGGACSVYPEDKTTVHEMLWPEQDGPLPVHTDGRLVANFRKVMPPRDSFQVMLVLSPFETPRTAWHKLLDAAWKQYYSLRAPLRCYENLWQLGISYAKLLYTEESDGFKGFSIGYTWDGGAWVKRNVQKYEIGWCGQNASLANSLLVHAKMTGDREAADMGLSVLDAWLAAARPTGLIPTHYDDNMYTNGYAKTVDACNLGTRGGAAF